MLACGRFEGCLIQCNGHLWYEPCNDPLDVYMNINKMYVRNRHPNIVKMCLVSAALLCSRSYFHIKAKKKRNKQSLMNALARSPRQQCLFLLKVGRYKLAPNKHN